MKKVLTGICLMMSVTFAQAQEYKLVWEDNFDSQTLNTKIWTAENNAKGGGNAEMQYYTPKNISFEKHKNGENTLVLNATRRSLQKPSASSARINTSGKLTVKYGRIDVRCMYPKQPTDFGLHSG
jgi:beta-glucanase (GH16 family)